MKRVLTRILTLALAILAAGQSGLALTDGVGAEEIVKAMDPRAAKAKHFWVEPEGDGAWVFYSTRYDSKQALFEGAFWYVDDARAVRLGEYTKNVHSWELLKCDPPVYYSNTRYDGRLHLHAAILKDGVPFEIEDVGPLTALYEYHGNVLGSTDSNVRSEDYYNYAFLGVRDGRFVEIAAQAIDEKKARKIPGMGEIIDTLKNGDHVWPDGVAVNGFLYRNAAPGRMRDANGVLRGSVTILVTRDGAPGYAYAFIDEDGVAQAQRSWENEIDVWMGEARARYDIGFEVVDTVIE